MKKSILLFLFSNMNLFHFSFLFLSWIGGWTTRNESSNVDIKNNCLQNYEIFWLLLLFSLLEQMKLLTLKLEKKTFYNCYVSLKALKSITTKRNINKLGNWLRTEKVPEFVQNLFLCQNVLVIYTFILQRLFEIGDVKILFNGCNNEFLL